MHFKNVPFDIFFLHTWRNQSCFEHRMLQCFKMFQNECCWFYDAFQQVFFCLSAQLKLISASLDSTTWPFFVQPGPCMSFQSFTQMHFYCFFFERHQHHVLNAFISLPNVFEWTRGLKFFLHKTAPNPFANVSTQLILVNLWISEVGCCCYYYCKCCCFCVYRWLPSVPPAALKRKTSRAPVQLNTHTQT